MWGSAAVGVFLRRHLDRPMPLSGWMFQDRGRVYIASARPGLRYERRFQKALVRQDRRGTQFPLSAAQSNGALRSPCESEPKHTHFKLTKLSFT